MSSASKPVKKTTKKIATIIKIGGRKVDFGKALPLTLGDAVAMKKQHGVDIAQLDGLNMSIEDFNGILSFVLKKADPEVTDEEIAGIDMRDIYNLTSQSLGSMSDLDPST